MDLNSEAQEVYSPNRQLLHHRGSRARLPRIENVIDVGHRTTAEADDCDLQIAPSHSHPPSDTILFDGVSYFYSDSRSYTPTEHPIFPPPMNCPFLLPTRCPKTGGVGLLSLRRDDTVPVLLQTDPNSLRIKNERDLDARDARSHSTRIGYSEGVVTNTQFGSFPHTTLVNVPWGSQIRASKVDTGSRGRQSQGQGDSRGTKRKRGESPTSPADECGPSQPLAPELNGERTPDIKAPVVASSGFAYLLPPTPELWTASLPHRTQVLYTPDTSFILQKLKVGPGSVLIEAGAGSGSFTHAAARAVFNGENSADLGAVYSYEFHQERVNRLRAEIEDHNLHKIVHVEHRDVCEEGFGLRPESLEPVTQLTTCYPAADAVFLDLPSPWSALPHLTRESSDCSPLHPERAIHICTFSPCIEQVQRTASELRGLGWVEIELCEVSNRRIDVRRQILKTGGKKQGERGVIAVAGSVEEALTKLRKVEQRFKRWHYWKRGPNADQEGREFDNEEDEEMAAESTEPFYRQGTLVHRSEEQLKTHTSYLLFAVLPRQWTKADEERAADRWPTRVPYEAPSPTRASSKRAQKRLINAERASRAQRGE